MPRNKVEPTQSKIHDKFLSGLDLQDADSFMFIQVRRDKKTKRLKVQHFLHGEQFALLGIMSQVISDIQEKKRRRREAKHLPPPVTINLKKKDKKQ